MTIKILAAIFWGMVIACVLTGEILFGVVGVLASAGVFVRACFYDE